MELDLVSTPQMNEIDVVDGSGQQVSRNNSRGIRVVGSRIYDSENGKSCHQVHFLSFYDLFFFSFFVLMFKFVILSAGKIVIA